MTRPPSCPTCGALIRCTVCGLVESAHIAAWGTEHPWRPNYEGDR